MEDGGEGGRRSRSLAMAVVVHGIPWIHIAVAGIRWDLAYWWRRSKTVHVPGCPWSRSNLTVGMARVGVCSDGIVRLSDSGHHRAEMIWLRRVDRGRETGSGVVVSRPGV